MLLYTDEELEEELKILQDEGIDNVAVRSKLGLSIIAQIVKTKSYCRLCKKDFKEIYGGETEDLEKIVLHSEEHFEDDFRSTISEIKTYFS